MGREQAAGLYYLACPKIQNINDALALLYTGRLGTVSIHSTYVGEALYIWGRWAGRPQAGSGCISGKSGHNAGMRTCSTEHLLKLALFST